MILCKLGIHRWAWRFVPSFSVKLDEAERFCARCGKLGGRRPLG
jgi:hypothetical protein